MKTWLSSKITRGLLDKFVRDYSSTEKTLDLGSSVSPYARHFPTRISCDIEAGEGVDVVADAHCLPFADDEFSVVLCTEVLEHLHAPHIAVAEMSRVLKPGVG